MQYNLHPIFVHFPIAFLTLYSVIVLLPFEKWLPKISWKDTRVVILVTGILGLMMARYTGGMAEDSVVGMHDIVEAHEVFASLTTWLYGILLLKEVVLVTNVKLADVETHQEGIVFLKKLENILENKYLFKIVAFAALIAIFVTGLLGGAMVYGTSADPLVPIVLRLLGLEI